MYVCYKYSYSPGTQLLEVLAHGSIPAFTTTLSLCVLNQYV